MTQSLAKPNARDFSEQQIQTRIKAASQPGFGLDKATRAQLNMIYLLAKHYDVDPAVDITLYRDRPWFTIDGRIRLMKRHPQYAGYKTRPLSQQEKEAWGYKVDDLVVECTIRTRDWGEIAARGKVSGAEQRSNAPTGSHPSEMAEKRAIARASRLAFGQDVPDEDEAGYVMEERNAPAKVAADARRYDEIFGEDAYELPNGRRVDTSTGEVLKDKASPPETERYVPTDVRDVDDTTDAIEAERQRKQEGLL